jgi:hypothetical protein
MIMSEHHAEPEHPLAPFYRAWGYRTWSRLGSLWIDAGRFSVISVPCSRRVTATRGEVERFVRDAGRIAAQFPTTADTGVLRNSYWVRDRGYGPASLKRQFRRHVAVHHDRCEVRPIEWQELATRGLPIFRDACARQGCPGPATSRAWEECCRVASRIPGLTAAACTVGGEPAAFLVAWVFERTCFVLMYHRSTRFDEFRPSHKLIAGFTRQTIGRPDVDAVTLGRDLVPAQGAVGAFKRHAGFRPEPISVAAVLDPRWRALLTHSCTRGILGSLNGLTGHRIDALGNVELLDVAAATRLPSG